MTESNRNNGLPAVLQPHALLLEQEEMRDLLEAISRAEDDLVNYRETGEAKIDHAHELDAYNRDMDALLERWNRLRDKLTAKLQALPAVRRVVHE